MAWTEHIPSRLLKGKVYKDGTKRAFFSDGAPLHYEGTIDSGVYDSNLDMTPVRTINAQLDGWLVEYGGYHYALGQPGDKSTDGWVGFGGRKGQNWISYRLARIGYMHYPTRAWDDISSTPDYDRANLSQEVREVTVKPTDDIVKSSSRAVWSNIWTTPGGGVISAEWIVFGDRLKENIIINQEARDWVVANHPPITPASETYFGFVFQIDASDIPKWVKNDIVQDINGDFDDSDGEIEIRDDIDRLLGFMPISDVVVDLESKPVDVSTRKAVLRKRIWQDGGNHYLLVGCRVDTLNQLDAGDLKFDPTWGSYDIQKEIIEGISAINKEVVGDSDVTKLLNYSSQIETIVNAFSSVTNLVEIISSLDFNIISGTSYITNHWHDHMQYGIFDGTDYLETSDSDLLSFGDSGFDNPFSLSAWIYLESYTFNAIAHKGSEYLWRIDGSGRPILLLWDTVNEEITSVTGDGSVPLNTWTHVSVTYDGSGTVSGIKHYINGSYITDYDSEGSANYDNMVNDDNGLIVGKWMTFKYIGKMHDFTLYDRVLYGYEIEDLYNQEAIEFGFAYLGHIPGSSISITDDPLLTFGNGTSDFPFSISFDFYLVSNPIQAIVLLKSKEYAVYAQTNGKMTFVIYDKNYVTTGYYLLEEISAGAMNRWHSYACTYDGSGNEPGLSIYRDGVKTSLFTITNGTYTAMDAKGNDPTIGVLGEFNLHNLVIYDKELSATEVVDVYNGVMFPSNTVAQYPLNSDAIDIGSNGLDGIESNTIYKTSVIADYNLYENTLDSGVNSLDGTNYGITFPEIVIESFDSYITKSISDESEVVKVFSYDSTVNKEVLVESPLNNEE